MPTYAKNTKARIITIGAINIGPNAVAEIPDELKDHKGLARMLKDSWLVKSDKKEYDAFVKSSGQKNEDVAEKADDKTAE